MSVQEMLKEMSSRAFNASYDAYMKNAYGLWAETDFKEEEYDYAKGVQDLDSVLTEEQHKKLKIMEENYRHNVEYCKRQRSPSSPSNWSPHTYQSSPVSRSY